MPVPVPAALGLKLQLRWARTDAGLTQAQLAKRLGVTQQMIGKLENPDYEPSISRLEDAVKALGGRLEANIRMGAAVGTVLANSVAVRKPGNLGARKRSHASSHR